MHVMSLPAMSFGDWFSVSRKGGTGGGGLVYAPTHLPLNYNFVVIHTQLQRAGCRQLTTVTQEEALNSDGSWLMTASSTG